MGSFYRSKHELVCAWKYGTASHTNTFELGTADTRRFLGRMALAIENGRRGRRGASPIRINQ